MNRPWSLAPLPDDRGLDDLNPKDAQGLKKPPIHLVPAILDIMVAMVFKRTPYPPYNWRTKKVRKSIYLDAIGRHYAAMKDGESTDSKSGLLHAAHIAANCAILMDAEYTGNLVDDMDYAPGPAPGLLKEFTE